MLFPLHFQKPPLTMMTNETLRSRDWFAGSGDPEMTALYLERSLNCSLTRKGMPRDRH